MATIEEWVQGARAAVPPEVIDVELEGDLPGWPQDKSIAGSTAKAPAPAPAPKAQPIKRPNASPVAGGEKKARKDASEAGGEEEEEEGGEVAAHEGPVERAKKKYEQALLAWMHDRGMQSSQECVIAGVQLEEAYAKKQLSEMASMSAIGSQERSDVSLSAAVYRQGVLQDVLPQYR